MEPSFGWHTTHTKKPSNQCRRLANTHTKDRTEMEVERKWKKETAFCECANEYLPLHFDDTHRKCDPLVEKEEGMIGARNLEIGVLYWLCSAQWIWAWIVCVCVSIGSQKCCFSGNAATYTNGPKYGLDEFVRSFGIAGVLGLEERERAREKETRETWEKSHFGRCKDNFRWEWNVCVCNVIFGPVKRHPLRSGIWCETIEMTIQERETPKTYSSIFEWHRMEYFRIQVFHIHL